MKYNIFFFKYIKRPILLLLLLCCNLLCGAVMQTVEYDFKSPSWQGMVRKLWGKEAEVIQDGAYTALEISAGSFYATPDIAIPRGAKVTVEFDAATPTAIIPGGEGWRTAAVQMDFLQDRNAVGHDDLFNTGRVTGWQKYTRTLPLQYSGFRINFGNYGKSGVLRIANLKITVESEGTNVERDWGFAGQFGINDWFVQKSGKDWDDVDLGKFSGAKVVKDVFPGAGSTLQLDGPCTVISQQFPYKGEAFTIGLWFSHSQITRGHKPWATAGVQLVFLDAEDKPIGHEDITREWLDGDRPWAYYMRSFPRNALSGQVKSLVIYCRIFDGATGTAWFDNISLLMCDDSVARKPYDENNGLIRIGRKPGEPLRPVWNGIDLSYCAQTGLPQVMTALRKLRESGIRYVRCREFFNGPFPVKKLNPGKLPDCDFTQLDSFMDPMVKELGFVMVPTLETIPPQLHTEPRGHVPADFKQWELCVEALVSHWIERYGKDTVSKWIFECWNEPGADFFVGTDAEFIKVFLGYLKALKRVQEKYNVKLHIGTPSGASWALLTKIMKAAANEGLDIVTDASIHIYGGYFGALALFEHEVGEARTRMAEFKCGKDVPIHVSEYNGAAMSSHYFDNQTGAAYFVKANRLWLDLGIERAYYYSVIDHPYLNLEHHFCGDLGIFSHFGPIPKPAFNALALLNRLQGRRLEVTTPAEPFDALACLDDDGTVQVIVTTFSEIAPNKYQRVPVQIEIDWSGLDKHVSEAKFAYVDSVNGNAYTEFQKAGSPLAKERRDVGEWIEKSAFETKNLTGYSFNGDKLVISMPMELNSVLWLKIKP